MLVCMQFKLVNILTYIQILSYKNGMQYNIKGQLKLETIKAPHNNLTETCADQ